MPKCAPSTTASRTLAAAEAKTLKQERQQAVAMHGAFPSDHLPQPKSDRNWLKPNAEPELGETFYTWKELAAAVSLTQLGRGMVRNNSNGAWQCEACRKICQGFSECLAFAICRARCLGHSPSFSCS